MVGEEERERREWREEGWGREGTLQSKKRGIELKNRTERKERKEREGVGGRGREREGLSGAPFHTQRP